MFTLLLQTAVADPNSWITQLPSIGSMGVGGTLAGIMFFFYRTDRTASEQRLTKITENFLQVIQDNTKAMTSVVDAVNKLK